MRIHSYYPPETEDGADLVSLRINIDTETKEINMKSVHTSAIIIYGEPLVQLAMLILKFLRVPPHYMLNERKD